MGCAPSATTAAATSPRLSLSDDKKAAEMAESDGIRMAVDTGDASASKATRINGDVPLAKASLSSFVHEQLKKWV